MQILIGVEETSNAGIQGVALYYVPAIHIEQRRYHVLRDGPDITEVSQYFVRLHECTIEQKDGGRMREGSCVETGLDILVDRALRTDLMSQVRTKSSRLHGIPRGETDP
ncbi:MAG: hypothetical protein GVY14_01770 [Spirochaetes bacterium]|nr:hypothetical protein [Spirochaetota bacterium]